MSYATQADIYARFRRNSIELLLDNKIENVTKMAPEEREIARASILQVALDDAAATIDGYIDGRATLPLKAVPAVLVKVACQLTRFALEDGKATDKATKDADDALRLLEKVAAGDISLGLSKDAERPEGGDIAIMTSAGSVWGRKSSKGFI